MANQEQLDILDEGVDVWNHWRSKHRTAKIDLSGVDLSNLDLRNAFLGLANFSKSNLSNVYFGGTNLNEADLSDANLRDAIFRKANLKGAYFVNAKIGGTVFAKVDLSKTVGLDKTIYLSPSSIDNHTIQLSEGKIHEIFLRGCGLSDADVEFAKLSNPDISRVEIENILTKIRDLRTTQALQISPLFISYSHGDKEFVDYLDTALTAKGIRFWRDVHDAKAGRLETQIDLAIRQNPTVLLILSKNSLSSDWVEHEVRHARKLEKELGRDALCPITLDDGWKSSPWPERVMEQVMEYNILDFSGWQDASTFDAKFAKLLSGLDLYYKKSTK